MNMSLACEAGIFKRWENSEPFKCLLALISCCACETPAYRRPRTQKGVADSAFILLALLICRKCPLTQYEIPLANPI